VIISLVEIFTPVNICEDCEKRLANFGVYSIYRLLPILEMGRSLFGESMQQIVGTVYSAQVKVT
jgi:hypothetical protein